MSDLLIGEITPFETFQICLDFILQLERYSEIPNEEKEIVREMYEALIKKSEIVLVGNNMTKNYDITTRLSRKDEVELLYHVEASVFFIRASLELVGGLLYFFLFNEPINESFSITKLFDKVRHSNTDPKIRKLFDFKDYLIRNDETTKNWYNFYAWVKLDQKNLRNNKGWSKVMRNVIAHERTLHVDFDSYSYFVRYIYKGTERLKMQLDDFFDFSIVGYCNFFLYLEHICFQYFKKEITDNIEEFRI